MSRKRINALIINGYAVPAPDEGFTISESTYGDFKRNANNAVVGQVVGRNLWKIEGLQWSELSVEEWQQIKRALSPFFVNVTFTTDTNERKTLMMYPSDRKANPIRVSVVTNEYGKVQTCKFNLIDCGY